MSGGSHRALPGAAALPQALPQALAALVLAASLLAACAGPRPPSPDAIARIDNQEVPYSDFEVYLRDTLGEKGIELESDVLSKLLDQFLDERLLSRLAVARGASAVGAPRRTAVDRLLRSTPVPQPDEAAVRSYYEAHEKDFERPERVHLRQILTEDRETAERALAELHAGKDFTAVSRRYSRDPSAESGGDQGELSRDDLPPSFVDTIFSLEPGQVSDIVGADYGFHIFQVIERLPAEVVPFDEAEGEIRERLRGAALDRLLKKLVQEARSRYTVEVYERNLPFNYQGRYREKNP